MRDFLGRGEALANVFWPIYLEIEWQWKVYLRKWNIVIFNNRKGFHSTGIRLCVRSDKSGLSRRFWGRGAGVPHLFVVVGIPTWDKSSGPSRRLGSEVGEPGLFVVNGIPTWDKSGPMRRLFFWVCMRHATTTARRRCRGNHRGDSKKRISTRWRLKTTILMWDKI